MSVQDMAKVGAVLDGIRAQEPALVPTTLDDGPPCEVCLERYPYLASEPRKICKTCEERQRKGQAMLARKDELAVDIAEAAGMERRELLAILHCIPHGIRSRLHQERLTPFLVGEIPTLGFGLSGPPGTGKTMTLAALFLSCIRERIERLALKDPRAAVTRFVEWVDWPTRVSELRAVSTREDGLTLVEKVVRDMIECNCLVLDDLGAERTRGAYDADYATDLLIRVLNMRHRQMMPVFYTTNRDMAEIKERYGSRFFSRVLSEWPLVTLPSDTPDARFSNA